MKLKEYVIVEYSPDYIYIYYRKGIKINNTKENMAIITSLIHGTSIEELLSNYNNYIVNNILSAMYKYNFIRKDENKYQNTIEERFIYYLEQYHSEPEKLFKNLNKACVCIIGVGGIGGNILQILASSGIKNFILIDFDKVEYSNLNRQFYYSVDDINKYKVNVCKEKLLKFDSTIKCYISCVKIESQEQLLDIISEYTIDVLVSAADSPIGIKNILRDVAKIIQCAYVEGSLGIDYGKYIFEEPAHLVMDHKDKKFDTNMKVLNKQIPLGSFGATNSIICSFMAMDIINYLLGIKSWSNGRKIVFDFNEMNYKVLS